jgi:carbamoyl-phosphate synthase large subunit
MISQKLNLFFTSAGRRDYLIEYFVAALGNRGCIHVGNSEPFCSAFTVGDYHVITPPIQSQDYIPFLLDYCRKEQIAAILPLLDIDIPVLARNKALFEKNGTKLIVPSLEVAELCNDKWLTYEFFRAKGISTPHTFIQLEAVYSALEAGIISFPLVVKPRWGMGSIGLMYAHDAQELQMAYQSVQRSIFSTHLKLESMLAPDNAVIIQQRVEGIEFGLDVLNNLDGEYVVTVAKRKLAMRSGETDIAVTEGRVDLKELGARLGALLAHPGNLDVDVIVNGDDLVVLELNCRFGGGYPFTHAAGAHFPAAIVAWLLGQEPDPTFFHAKPNITSLKSITMKMIPI